MPERWVVNASPVILLAKAGVIHLLPSLCDNLVIPAGVVGEVEKGDAADAGRAWLKGGGSQFIQASPRYSMIGRRARSHAAIKFPYSVRWG